MSAQGATASEIARRTMIPRSTVRSWLEDSSRAVVRGSGTCDPCDWPQMVPQAEYAYLLGLYLGDGCLSVGPRSVYRLRIVLDLKYAGIIEECVEAMARVLPNKVGRVNRPECVEVYSYSKHWVCLFPQHGSGPKHMRAIVLDAWQERIALDQYPHLFLRGLIHSDGWRGMNRVGNRYAYSRYMFSNRSLDIRDLFQAACSRMGIQCRRTNQWQIAVSRRLDVAKMDTFIGEKR